MPKKIKPWALDELIACVGYKDLPGAQAIREQAMSELSCLRGALDLARHTAISGLDGDAMAACDDIQSQISSARGGE